MDELNIDWTQIQAWEGFRTKMYVPECTNKSVINPKNAACFGKKTGSPIGRSGVTIGSGVDLGQQNEYDLISKGVPKSVIKKVKPFLGKKKTEAQKALAANQKVILTKDVINEIDRAYKRATARELEAKYDNQGKENKFTNLPAHFQTVLASIYWQKKNNMFEGDLKKFWEYALEGNNLKAAEELDKQKLYSDRRKQEAAYLRKIPSGK
jgi:hypothetical protein